jgi:hypothetical protein
LSEDRGSIAARTREIMASDGLAWQDAWLVAEAKQSGEEPRKQVGCLVGGLRFAFWAVIGFTIYLVLVMLVVYGLEFFASDSVDDDGWGILIAMVGMAASGVAAVLLARRFPKIPVMLMASVVLLTIGVFGGFVVFQIATGPSQDSIAATERYERLESTLDRTVSSVPVPAEWEVESWGGYGGYSNAPSMGYTLSPDLSSSGTRMVIWVSDGSEDAFWEELDVAIEREAGAALVEDPLPTSLSGVPGHLFEVSGLVGPKTGQELGAYWAVFFGPEYTYGVMVQFELPDREDMRLLYRNTLTQLTLIEDANEV